MNPLTLPMIIPPSGNSNDGFQWYKPNSGNSSSSLFMGFPSDLFQFVIALIVFLVILSAIGEPYSTWFAGIVILSGLFYDVTKNGKNGLFAQLGL